MDTSKKSEYQLLRKILIDMGYTLESGDVPEVFCFSDGRLGYVYLTFRSKRVIEVLYENPMIAVRINSDDWKTDPIQVIAERNNAGDCLLTFRGGNRWFQLMSIDRVPNKSVLEFNEGIRRTA